MPGRQGCVFYTSPVLSRFSKSKVRPRYSSRRMRAHARTYTHTYIYIEREREREREIHLVSEHFVGDRWCQTCDLEPLDGFSWLLSYSPPNKCQGKLSSLVSMRPKDFAMSIITYPSGFCQNQQTHYIVSYRRMGSNYSTSQRRTSQHCTQRRWGLCCSSLPLQKTLKRHRKSFAEMAKGVLSSPVRQLPLTTQHHSLL